MKKTHSTRFIQARPLLMCALVLSALCIHGEAAWAEATGVSAVNTELAKGSEFLEKLINGKLGQVIAVASLLLALIGSVFRFNAMLLVGAVGVGIAASIGPAVIKALVG